MNFLLRLINNDIRNDAADRSTLHIVADIWIREKTIYIFDPVQNLFLGRNIIRSGSSNPF